ncbi:MAG: hypothetical protein SVV03_05590 [Candidatus Nanohaloarchaea archaeon]|nr:hypothetical protein [Candidatus Nanohaloarchaea archaeon]
MKKEASKLEKDMGEVKEQLEKIWRKLQEMDRDIDTIRLNTS